MKEFFLETPQGKGIEEAAVKEALSALLESWSKPLRKVLLLPPDYTRSHSGAGKITATLYEMLKDTCQVDIMPALGTHMAMNDKEITLMFGPDIPISCFFPHNWRNDVVSVGEVPGSYVKEVSEGLIDYPMEVQLNRRLLDPSYDLILSIGQVVPHEVVGMANFNKNIFVGCGGTDMINKSHMLGAVYGMEQMMGRDHTPVRKVFDYAENSFLKGLPLLYLLTVTTQQEGKTCINGLYGGRSRTVFEKAVLLSQKLNLNFMDKPFQKVVVNLDPDEFKSTWLGNKSVYRTRMAIGDAGELMILAPGVKQFGEDPQIDRLIRKYGYVGRDKVLSLYKENEDLKQNLSVAAHLIHGSSDGRFSITYAVDKLTKEEIENVSFNYMSYTEAIKRYNPDILKEGYNTLADGEVIYYIPNPAVGLWALKGQF